MKLLPPIDPDLDALGPWLATLPGVQAAWLFGSRARGDARPNSDVDVAILVDPEADPGFWERMEWAGTAPSIMGVPDDAVDVVFMREVSPLLAQSVLREGRLLVDGDPGARVAFQDAHLHRFIVAKHLRDQAMRARARRYGVELP